MMTNENVSFVPVYTGSVHLLYFTMTVSLIGKECLQQAYGHSVNEVPSQSEIMSCQEKAIFTKLARYHEND